MKDLLFTPEGKEFLLKKYISDGLSTYAIASEIETYPNHIRRAMHHHGIPLRDRTEAQRLALEAGRQSHPTQGRQRDEETKERISEAAGAYWDGLTQEARNKHAQIVRERWEKMSESKRENIRKRAEEGLRQTTKGKGSRMERELYAYLVRQGFQVTRHAPLTIGGENMHVDLWIGDLKVAIEVDGPAHHFPIWGEDDLLRRRDSDARKTGLLVGCGSSLVRVRHLGGYLSERRIRRTLGDVYHAVESCGLPPRERGVELIVEIK